MQTQMKYLSGVKLSWFTFKIMINPLACSFLHLASWVELSYSSWALDAMRAIRSLTREALWIYIYIHVGHVCTSRSVASIPTVSSKLMNLVG